MTRKGGASTSIKVEGVEEVNRALKKIAAEAADMKEVHRAVAESLIAPIQAATPKKSGKLASSFKPRGLKGRAKIANRLVYAPVIEYGWPTHGIMPALMVQHTIDAKADAIMGKYSDEIQKLIDREGFKE